MYLHR